MCERKAWAKEEDQLLAKIMLEKELEPQQKKLKWNDIAVKINQLTSLPARKGKQCRQRWFNQLHPNINKQTLWTEEQEQILFKFQEEYGNHWAKISKQIPGRSDNNIKNYFYSCLRKALRKVNNFVNYNKRNSLYKNLKAFQATSLTKILAVAENKIQNKILIVKENAGDLAREIKNLLVQIQVFKKIEPTEKDSELYATVVQKIQDFNRICKRKKSKKKEIKKKQFDQNLKPPKSSNQMKPLSDEQSQSEQDSNSIQNENGHSQAEMQEISSERIQPLQRSQPLQTNKQQIISKFPSSSECEQTKKLQQSIIIPSCRYNCQSNLTSKITDIKQQSNTSFSSSIIHNNKSNNVSAEPLITYFPFAHPSYYHGSAFMPTTFFQPSYSPVSQYDFKFSYGQSSEPCLGKNQQSNINNSSIKDYLNDVNNINQNK